MTLILIPNKNRKKNSPDSIDVETKKVHRRQNDEIRAGT